MIGGKRHRAPLRVMSDLNVTNLLDTAFTLLITLMMILPQLSHGIKLDLPDTQAQALDREPSKTLTVSVQALQPGDEREHVYLGSERIEIDDLIERVMDEVAQKPEIVVELQADRNASYGTIFAVLEAVKRAGVENIDLSSEPSAARSEREPGRR